MERLPIVSDRSGVESVVSIASSVVWLAAGKVRQTVVR